MGYKELLERIKAMQYRHTRFDVVSFLIACQGHISVEDYCNIQKLYDDGWIDA